MNLYSVIFLKGHLVAATMLLPGTTVHDCENMNAAYVAQLPSTPFVKAGQVKPADVRATCEMRDSDPTKKPAR